MWAVRCDSSVPALRFPVRLLVRDLLMIKIKEKANRFYMPERKNPISKHAIDSGRKQLSLLEVSLGSEEWERKAPCLHFREEGRLPCK